MHSNHFPPYPIVSVVAGVAHIYVGVEKLHETKEPAFLLDHYTGTVLRYGDRDVVQATCDGMQRSYEKYDLEPRELEVVVFSASVTRAETLQSFIEHPHALSAWVAENRALAA